MGGRGFGSGRGFEGGRGFGVSWVGGTEEEFRGWWEGENMGEVWVFWGEPIALRAMYQRATFQNSVPKRLENLENECDQGQVMQFERFPVQ